MVPTLFAMIELMPGCPRIVQAHVIWPMWCLSFGTPPPDQKCTLSTRIKRDFTETQRFFASVFPLCNVGKVASESINLASALEKVANDTSIAVNKINDETVAIWPAALQN